MSDKVCKTCGLPKELCACVNIAKDEQSSIKVYGEKRKWGKEVTVISGIDDRSIDLRGMTKRLKGHLATGGTHKGGRIELQGNHLYRISELLKKEGFDESSIEIL